MLRALLDNPLPFIAILGAIALGVVSLLLVRYHRTIARLRLGVARFSRGDLEERLPVEGPRPLRDLAHTLNQMAARLDEVVRTAVRQRNELEAVLSSMIEGVIAVDMDERVLSVNVAAAQLFDLDPARSVGRSIQEVIRNTALQQFVAQMLRSDSPMQADIVLRAGASDDAAAGPRYLQAQGAVLRDATGQHVGALIAMHDVTRLRRLEAVRRDFVANVSHEVKTPVAAIKASVETLLDAQQTDPADTQRFLRIIQRQADRLHALVEDLLTLARIEQDGDRQRVVLRWTRLADVLAAAVEACQFHAQARRTAIELSCDPALQARVNDQLLEHAVINLVDNAVKYSPEDRTVRVSAARHGAELVITVEDEGLGIEAEHLPRIFERFYRTDRARNRAQGGTGLGLAIVKHAAQAHAGRVSVESTPGKGSTFRIHLPAT